MRNDRWPSWLLTTFSMNSGLLYVLALLLGGFFVQEQCFAQPASGAAAIEATTGWRWVPTGNLNVARSYHTATLLLNGKVLVVGGQSSNSPVDAELYDPSAGTWSITGRLNHSRNGHTATLLPDGRVLVVGGFGAEEAAELYDPDTGAWSPAGRTLGLRRGHTATLLRNGTVLVVGGWGAQPVTLYNPATGMWSFPGPFPIYASLVNFAATLLQSGEVLIVGGMFDPMEGTPLASAELYDPVAGTRKPTGNMSIGRDGPTASLLPNGKVLVVGGTRYASGAWISDNSSTVYDPATETWGENRMLNAAREGHSATLLANGEVLVTGGYAGRYEGGRDAPRVYASGAELYHANNTEWRATASLHTARAAHTATLLPNGKVLVAGGFVPGLTPSDYPLTIADAELYEQGPALATIGSGYTGSWYDPAQSGHGFALEVLQGQLLAYWFTFAPQGGQSWIAALGPLDGNRAMLQGVQTVGAGARFPPNFDPANARQESWGTLTFTFSDCNHGHVDWNSTVPGYGGGGMDLTRLTLPAGLSCSDDDSGMGYWDY